MAALVKSVDQILGCVPSTAVPNSSQSHSLSVSSYPGHHANEAHTATAPQSMNDILHSLPTSSFPSTLDIQEKYIDNKEEYREWERKQWEKEGDDWLKLKSKQEKERATEREKRQE